MIQLRKYTRWRHLCQGLCVPYSSHHRRINPLLWDELATRLDFRKNKERKWGGRGIEQRDFIIWAKYPLQRSKNFNSLTLRS